MKLPAAIAILAAGIAIGLLLPRPLPATPPTPPHPAPPSPDTDLVRSLLAQNLSSRRFDFPTIVRATSGKQILPLDDSPAHRRVTNAIRNAITETISTLNQPDSPVRKLRRINEASRFFEDGIMQHLNSQPGFTCEIPPNRDGNRQRSGYPDLRITDESSGLVFYLDPKLVEQSSLKSTLRSFYFAPKTNTLKITDDATHLLVGITHDGHTGAWTFTGFHLVDLSNLSVRLKAEFQASNADLYKSPNPAPHSPLSTE